MLDIITDCQGKQPAPSLLDLMKQPIAVIFHCKGNRFHNRPPTNKTIATFVSNNTTAQPFGYLQRCDMAKSKHGMMLVQIGNNNNNKP